MTTDLRFPIGKAEMARELTAEQRLERIARIERMPDHLRAAVAGLDAGQLDTPYRPEGWTVRQVVHHVPDSHLNAYLRCKWALTEDEPQIKTYDEGLWAELPDSRTVPVEVSLALLDSLHKRWMGLLRALSAADFQKALRHPEHGLITLDQILGLYAWHGDHHVAHITTLRERMGWS
ncbi:MAG TPA: putative metal-dependent hydrolase [Thermoanaerobaculia bacterium]|nr:putative metal-dependent hydrolase [Thermoanaerobaculia bacterium]